MRSSSISLAARSAAVFVDAARVLPEIQQDPDVRGHALTSASDRRSLRPCKSPSSFYSPLLLRMAREVLAQRAAFRRTRSTVVFRKRAGVAVHQRQGRRGGHVIALQLG